MTFKKFIVISYFKYTSNEHTIKVYHITLDGFINVTKFDKRLNKVHLTLEKTGLKSSLEGLKGRKNAT